MKKGFLTTEFDEAHVARYQLIERTELMCPDVCLVFGNANICEQQADQVVGLYKEGFAPLIVVTGGAETDNGEKEAVRIRARLLKKGVPASRILFECESTNTQENIENAKRLLAEHGKLESIHSVIGVGHIAAGRRFLMTMAKRWPGVLAMQINVNPYGVPVTLWHTHEAFAAKVKEEAVKIPAYLDRGFLREIDLERLDRIVLDVRTQELAIAIQHPFRPVPSLH